MGAYSQVIMVTEILLSYSGTSANERSISTLFFSPIPSNVDRQVRVSVRLRKIFISRYFPNLERYILIHTSLGIKVKVLNIKGTTCLHLGLFVQVSNQPV